ncbi:PstS family phosphate ABC transporter substrate-binding protein [Streptomyces sp. 8N114]|uniref:PstS family phosphate ABC transporter substrate-binding protein n=1 Tax=Streptomyces sp. 8N114 TaxID=3457419 RepID=UPI003FD33A5C
MDTQELTLSAWLSPENLLAVLGLLASVGVLAYERLMPGLKRIGYRVQMDTAISARSDTSANRRTNVLLGHFGSLPEMSNASLVLLRIENDGLRGIAADDYTSREVSGLTATFGERRVIGLAVTEPSADHLMGHLGPHSGLRHEDNTIHLPKVPLNRGDHFKLLVLLTGSGTSRHIVVDGGVKDGAVKRNRRQPRPSNRVLVLIGFLSLLLLLEPVLLTLNERPPLDCATGSLRVSGSTAFAPVAEEAGRAYERRCPGARITVDPRGSNEGTVALQDAGRRAKDGVFPEHIAFSDGQRQGGLPQLRSRRIAISVFTLVVNEKAGVRELSLKEIQKIYRGEYRDWSDVGGNKLPIRLVSRDAQSGTRRALENHLLNGEGEPQASSRDCVTPYDSDAPTLRCERTTTRRVLDTVADVPGALGYAELSAATASDGVGRVRIDGRQADTGTVAVGDYPFRETEYAYTYGRPPARSLAASFLTYLVTGTGQHQVAEHGHLPCAQPEYTAHCAL